MDFECLEMFKKKGGWGTFEKFEIIVLETDGLLKFLKIYRNRWTLAQCSMPNQIQGKALAEQSWAKT